jgi:ketosteroid isomerase-like protein
MENQNLDVVIRTFEWFNSVMSRSGGAFTREEVALHFTPDARMIANGQVKCAGIEAHLAHFLEMQKKLKYMRIRLPEKRCTVSGDDKCAAYYVIEYTTAEGEEGLLHDSALWTIRDGRIAEMVETVSFEGKEVPLENHS